MFLADNFSQPNSFRLQLQACDVSTIQANYVVSDFIKMLTIFRQNIGGRNLDQFPWTSIVRDNYDRWRDFQHYLTCNLLEKRFSFRVHWFDAFDLPK